MHQLRVCFLIISLFGSRLALAQQEIVGGGFSLADFKAGLVVEGISGNMLAFDNWRPGVYVNTKGDTSENHLFNFHTNSDKLFILKASDNLVYNLNENLISSLLLRKDGSEEVETFDLIDWQSFKSFPDYPRFCVYLIKKPDFELIKYYDKHLRLLGQRPDSYQGFKSDELVSRVQYYWRNSSNGGFEEIDLTKQQVNAILSKEQKSKMKGYIKANKLKWTRESDVLKMLASVF